MTSSKEIEIKGRIGEANLAKMREWLDANCERTFKEHQIDTYLDRVTDSFWPVAEDGTRDGPDFLRVRESKSNSITFKHWIPDDEGNLTHCDEYEVAIGDAKESIAMLGALGFLPAVTIDKTREIYQFLNFEVAIDHVSGLGTFFEVEWKGKSCSPPEALQEIDRFLHGTGMTGYEKMTRGYVSMFLNPGHNYGVRVEI